MDMGLTLDTALIATDWRQTQIVSESCHSGGNLRETNSLYGVCPSMATINRNMAINLIALYGLSYTLKGRWRDIFLISVGVVEGKSVYSNFKLEKQF